MRYRAICLVTLGFLAAGLCHAASIPAWLDDAISKWNQENPAVQIRFVDIKDSFVWYMIPDTPETGHQVVRERTYTIAEANGYRRTEAEELVRLEIDTLAVGLVDHRNNRNVQGAEILCDLAVFGDRTNLAVEQQQDHVTAGNGDLGLTPDHGHELILVFE